MIILTTHGNDSCACTHAQRWCVSFRCFTRERPYRCHGPERHKFRDLARQRVQDAQARENLRIVRRLQMQRTHYPNKSYSRHPHTLTRLCTHTHTHALCETDGCACMLWHMHKCAVRSNASNGNAGAQTNTHLSMHTQT